LLGPGGEAFAPVCGAVSGILFAVGAEQAFRLASSHTHKKKSSARTDFIKQEFHIGARFCRCFHVERIGQAGSVPGPLLLLHLSRVLEVALVSDDRNQPVVQAVCLQLVDPGVESFERLLMKTMGHI